jgi:transcriptional regulator with XRE-family HTH domain
MYGSEANCSKGGAMNKKKSLRSLAKELGVSASYLSQARHGKRPASQ